MQSAPPPLPLSLSPYSRRLSRMGGALFLGRGGGHMLILQSGRWHGGNPDVDYLFATSLIAALLLMNPAQFSLKLLNARQAGFKVFRQGMHELVC